MLLTLTCHAPHAPDIGFLLGKNPASVFERPFSGGAVWAFYPEVADDHVTVAMLTEIDPIGLVRGPAPLTQLGQYEAPRAWSSSRWALSPVARGLAQPALKCRGREYLRIIYGPDYTESANLERLRSRGLATKRSLAAREFALGIEALERFTRREPLWRTHQAVFAVLAMESEPVDPRL